MPFRKYTCLICDHVYNEAAGDLDSGIAPGTRWEDLPAEWTCPECGATKSDFTVAECALS